MKKYLKVLRRATAACDALNNLVLEIMMFAFLLMVVIAGLLCLWWYPVNYLSEGNRFHERRITKFMKCVGFNDICHVVMDPPNDQFLSFKTKCSVWVTSDDGETYHPIEFFYRYERRGWLKGASSFSPTRDAFAEKHGSALNRYLTWSGTSREQWNEMFARQDQALSN